jgi:hypothetical protein
MTETGVVWFAARLLLESVHPEEPDVEKVFEDRIIVLRARSEDEALEKARKFGKASRQEYKNEYGKTVIWELREILDVVELFDETLEDGSEVYYSILGEEKAKSVQSMFSVGRGA